MRKEDYNLMHALESDFWWFVGMREITRALIGRYVTHKPKHILDVGCGTGINLLWMRQACRPERLIGCDYSETAVNWCRETIAAASRGGVLQLSRGDVRHLPFQNACFDFVISLDVLDVFSPGDDAKAMGELHRVLRPGGFVFVRAPAYQWLLSSHDILFETKHRYTTSELQAKIGLAGFQPIRTTYANTVLFPLVAIERLLRKAVGLLSDKTDAQPWPKWLEWLNQIFKAALLLEARALALGWRLPFGLSAICIGRKTDRRQARPLAPQKA